MNARVQFPMEETLSAEFKQLVTSMLSREPESRPDLDAILKSAWLGQFYERIR